MDDKIEQLKKVIAQYQTQRQIPHQVMNELQAIYGALSQVIKNVKSGKTKVVQQSSKSPQAVKRTRSNKIGEKSKQILVSMAIKDPSLTNVIRDEIIKTIAHRK